MFDKFIIMLAKKIGKYVAAIVAEDLQFKTFEISSLHLEPGDTLIFRIKGHLPDEAHERLQKNIELNFPGHKAVVVEEEMGVAVLKNDKTE